MSAIIRRAKPGDLAGLLPLWTRLHEGQEALDPRYRMGADADLRWSNDFREYVRAEGHLYLVAETAGPVGFLVAEIVCAPPVYASERFVHINEIFVAPEHRGRGLGGRLVAEAVGWGRSGGVGRLAAGILARNEAGRGFWRSVGAEDFSVTVTIRGD